MSVNYSQRMNRERKNTGGSKTERRRQRLRGRDGERGGKMLIIGESR